MAEDGDDVFRAQQADENRSVRTIAHQIPRPQVRPRNRPHHPCIIHTPTSRLL